MADKNKPTYETVFKEYNNGLKFNTGIGLEDTVKNNENFFIGNQWDGVVSNGLPTPVFNFLKRVVLFTVAGITSNNIKMNASLISAGKANTDIQKLFKVVNTEFDRLFEINKIPMLIREYLRNAAVDGDACTFTYWDSDIVTGQKVKGAICTEIIENTRVFFGNPNSRRVQKQPYIIVMSREMIDDVKDRAKENGFNPDLITLDNDDRNVDSEKQTDDKVTVLLKLWRNKETGTIWAYECVNGTSVRKAWDMKLTLYPITWLNWDYIQDNYHGQAMITGLIPNQEFVNKMFAMCQLSLMTTAYPKIIYNKNYLKEWNNGIGKALGVNGPVTDAAMVMKGAPLDAMIPQFIQLAIETTQSNLGATSVALGDTRPDNTSAIVALQKAAATPNEITKQNLYQSLEDLGRIYIDFMAENYGVRDIEQTVPKEAQDAAIAAGLPLEEIGTFNFAELKNKYYSIKLDVGAAALWSEIATQQTLDNLFMNKAISVVQYLERIPDGYITGRQELIDELKGMQLGAMPPTAPSGSGGANTSEVIAGSAPPPVPTRGDSTMTRAIRQAAGQ